MTARRDLAELERQGIARRTHGGAVLPSISAQEDSFAQRVEVATEAKMALAEAAVAMLSPRETIFLDSSSTAYFVARRIVDLGLGVTVITNSLPGDGRDRRARDAERQPDRHRRHAAPAHPLVRRAVRRAHRARALRRPHVPVGQGRHPRRRA